MFKLNRHSQQAMCYEILSPASEVARSWSRSGPIWPSAPRKLFVHHSL